MTSKPRVIKDYDKVDPAIMDQIKLNYPYGFDRDLILFKNAKGKLVSALPFEAEDMHYLIRMTRDEAIGIIRDDEDFDANGNLKEEVKGELELKYEEVPEEIVDAAILV